MLHDIGEDASFLECYVPYFKRILPNANILLLDARAHGNSDGQTRGLAFKDRDDLALWCDYISNKYHHDLILFGKGLGANTILNASGENMLTNVKAIISDGAPHSFVSYIAAGILKKYKLDDVISTPIIKRVLKKETGYSTSLFDSINYIKNNKIPTIYIHSKNDKKVPFKQVFDLYNNNLGDAYLFPVKEDHFFEMDQDEEYSHLLEDFLNQYVL